MNFEVTFEMNFEVTFGDINTKLLLDIAQN
jgi:hypothetical protein